MGCRWQALPAAGRRRLTRTIAGRLDFTTIVSNVAHATVCVRPSGYFMTAFPNSSAFTVTSKMEPSDSTMVVT